MSDDGEWSCPDCNKEYSSEHGLRIHYGKAHEGPLYGTEKLADDLRGFAEELGEVPTAQQMADKGPHSVRLYERHLDGWNQALEAAGLEINKRYNVSQEELVDNFYDVVEDIGRTPTQEELIDLGDHSLGAYIRHFGSYNSFLESEGLEKNNERNISREDLIEDLKRIYRETGEVPTKEAIEIHSEYSIQPYYRVFGSIRESAQAAGFDPAYYRGLSDSKLLEMMVNLADELGQSPTVDQFNEHAPAHASTLINRFGTYNDALQEAGLEPNLEVHNPEEKLLNEVLRLSEELGRTPSTKDMADKGKFSPSTYERRFDTWNDALREVGLEVIREWKLPPEERLDVGYGSMWPRRREEAMERDGNKCVSCPTTLEQHLEEHGRTLHVHHIRPFRKFVEDGVPDYEAAHDLNNLMTVCVTCHRKWEGIPLRPHTQYV